MDDAAESSAPATQPANRSTDLSAAEAKRAAELIQRTYRGHRTRRQLNGYGLDASTRWYEAVKDAHYKAITTPRAPTDGDATNGEGTGTPTSPARSKWRQATHIAQRAGADDKPPSISDVSDDAGAEEDDETKEDGDAMRKKTAKMMDLNYFLELVDQKHRYGSNLRKYHAHWKTADTEQSFFYWLDQGEGKDLDLPECSRKRLDSMQVRYLSREERLKYLVKVNEQGLLVWAKNDELVWTKDELYRDSVDGIVPIDDSAPTWKHNVPLSEEDSESISSDSDSEEQVDNTAPEEGEQYVNEEVCQRGYIVARH
jgi:hypothetical protein